MCVYYACITVFSFVLFLEIYSLCSRREREREKKSYVARALSVNLLPCQNLNKNKIVRDFFGGGYITFPSYVPFACIFFIYTLHALYLPTETDRIQLKQFMKGAVDMKS